MQGLFAFFIHLIYLMTSLLIYVAFSDWHSPQTACIYTYIAHKLEYQTFAYSPLRPYRLHSCVSDTLCA